MEGLAKDVVRVVGRRIDNIPCNPSPRIFHTSNRCPFPTTCTIHVVTTRSWKEERFPYFLYHRTETKRTAAVCEDKFSERKICLINRVVALLLRNNC